MQTINLYLHKKSIIPVLHAKQGDVGRKFQVEFADGIPDGVAFSAWYYGTSGEGNYTAIGDRSAFAVSGNTVTVELITQMLTNPGTGKLCLIMTAEGLQLASWNIPYEVEHVPGMDSDPAALYYTAFSEVAAKAAGSAARAEAAAAKFDILNIFPVGYIYMSVSAVSPAVLFGGTWERIEGAFLLSASNKHPAGETGGEESHTLTVSETPFYAADNETEGLGLTDSATFENRVIVSSPGASAHNNMPPYLAVYMWKRVA
ncbi:MAG: hypothetical protein J6K03_01205 [Oscillospiraceae bacterium]|nr:hypothetical protein [Oscillospiraceae bacterium]